MTFKLPYFWPLPLDVGDTLTLADGRQFRVIDSIDLELEHDRAIDRLLKVASIRVERQDKRVPPSATMIS